MPKKRVHEIAKERGMSSKALLAKLQEAGLDVKAAASAVDEQAVLRVLNDGGGNGTPQASGPPPPQAPRPPVEPDGNPPQEPPPDADQPQRQRPTRSGLQGERAPGLRTRRPRGRIAPPPPRAAAPASSAPPSPPAASRRTRRRRPRVRHAAEAGAAAAAPTRSRPR